ncbi:hypothetical protein [Streptomyces alboviridis]|uniref:hypothetical protein n=1 Tax=Streptomyces alboviridis TaxID=67269 RepID=UPI001F20A8FC|nr:hypothetical protein [Streptomyces alboviridis]
MIEKLPSSGGGESPNPGRSTASLSTTSASSGISADQFCEDPPSPCTKSAGGSPVRSAGRERTVSVSPGSATERSRSPSATRTALTVGAIAAAMA